jgi:hypothetical protein
MNTKPSALAEERYITQMKEFSDELPVVSNDESRTPLVPSEVEAPKKMEESVLPEASFTETLEDISPQKVITWKEGILIAINILSVICLLFLIVELPKHALAAKDLRVQHIKNQSSQSVEYAEIASAKAKTDQLKKLFLDDSGIVDFVSSVETLKVKYPAIQRINFPSQENVKDRTGSIGIPVIIEMSGGQKDILDAMYAIESLPYLFRTMSVDVRPSKDDPLISTVKYGGMLYVSDQLANQKNR